jgi:hypothetical protein
MNWYYALGDQRQGPISDADLDALIATGKVTENTLVWREGMPNWAPLKEARPAAAADVPPGWIRCTATGRYFPPEEIVYLDGKPYSAAAKPGVLQEVMQTGALPSSDIERDGPPWEIREKLGFFPAIVQTVKGVLLEPSATFAKMKRQGGLGRPLVYYALLSWVGGVVALAYNFGIQSATNSFVPHNQNPFNPMVFGAGFMVIWALLMPVILVLSAFVGSGILHLSLMLCQGAKQPFETTFRVHCYAMGSVAPLQFIPICGAYAAIVWSIVAVCIGFAKAHEITTGRAVLATLLPMAVCCVAGIFIVVAVMGSIAAASQSGHH